MRIVSLLLLAGPLVLGTPTVAQKPVTRPKILGVAHLAVFVSDLARARAFYEDFLGFEEPFTLPKPDGSVEIAFVKINDRQWIELFNRPSEGEGQLNHIAVYTDDAERHPSHCGVEDCCPCHALHRGAVPQVYGGGRRQMPRWYARRRRHAFPWGGYAWMR